MKKIVIFLFGSFLCVWGGLLDFQAISKAQEAYQNKEYDKALIYLQSLAKSKDSPQLEYNLGNTYYQKGDYEKALAAYENAQGVDPMHLEYNKGNAYAKQGKFDEAIESYKNALKIREDADARTNLEIVKKAKKEQSKKSENQNKKEQNKSSEQQNSNQGKENHQNSPSQKQDENRTYQRPKNTPKNKSTQEIEHLLKKLQSKQMPTFMYGLDAPQRRDDAKAW